MNQERLLELSFTFIRDNLDKLPMKRILELAHEIARIQEEEKSYHDASS